MSIIQKLSTALQGGAREVAEGVIDANALRILGQEIYECEQDVSSSKQRLALIIAEKTQVTRDIESLQKSNEKYEQQVLSLLNEGNEEKATKVAQLMAEQEVKLEQKQQHHTKLKSHEQALQGSLKKTVLGLDRFKSEYKMVKATENMQKAQSKIADSVGSASRFTSMQESLDRIQEKQQESTDKIDAMEQVEATFADTLEESFDDTPSAEDVLQRIKAKNKIAEHV